MNKTALSLSILLFMTSCQVAGVARVRDRIKYNTLESEVAAGKFADGEVDLDFAKIHEFATMCEFVYETENKGKKTHVAQYKAVYWNNPWIEKLFQESPKDCTSGASESQKWTRLGSLPEVPKTPIGRRFIAGLVYDVWVKECSTPEVVVVFRGSDFQTGDWITNFRGLNRGSEARPNWDQYDQVTAIADDLSKRIQEWSKGKNVRVFTAGHSLGGGLAQHLAYILKDHQGNPWVKKVFTFNSSPVTGFHALDERERLERMRFAMGLTIYKVFEKGEVLSALRLPGKILGSRTRANPRMVEVRFNLIQDGFFKEHSISKLAKELRRLHAERAAKATCSTKP